MYVKRLICLANSRKPPSGRCIAGKEYDGVRLGQWIRPVSSRAGHGVSEEDRQYEDGTKTQLLDIVRVPLERHSPLDHQVENHILAEDYYWSKEGTATWEQVCAAADPYDRNFWVNASSTYHGINDKVPNAVAAALQSSLKLIILPDVVLIVRMEEGFEGRAGRRRLRARFEYKGKWYLLSVTDPELEEHYLRKADREYEARNAALCISLAEPWNGSAFRVVASVITSDQCRT